MSIEKIEEFAESGEKHLNNLDVKQGFQQAEKPERQWFNYLLNDFSKKINQVIDGLSDIDFEFDGFAPKISELESNYTEISSELTRVSDDFKSADAVLQGQIDGIGGGKFAYTTYAKMEAAAALPDEDPLKLPANSSIDVTNDTDPLKNGTYSYDGAVFAKSIYDVETIVRTKVLNTFKTKSLMDASALPDGADAQVTDDTINNGLYVKTAGAWVKSDYDPLSLAKNYTDAQIESSGIKPDTETIVFDGSLTYIDGFFVDIDPSSPSGYKWSSRSGEQVAVIPVEGALSITVKPNASGVAVVQFYEALPTPTDNQYIEKSTKVEVVRGTNEVFLAIPSKSKYLVVSVVDGSKNLVPSLLSITKSKSLQSTDVLNTLPDYGSRNPISAQVAIDLQEQIKAMGVDSPADVVLDTIPISEKTPIFATHKNFILKDELVNGVSTIFVSTDLGLTWTQFVNTIGKVTNFHFFVDGSIMLCGTDKVYTLNNDYTALVESSVFDQDGSVFVPENAAQHHHFFNLIFGNQTQYVGDTEMFVWGEYRFEGTIRVWYTADRGKTIKCAIKFGTTLLGSWPTNVRHVHMVTQRTKDEKFYVTTGDFGGENMVLKGSYDVATDTWSWDMLAQGPIFKFGDIFFDDYYAYLMTDYTTPETRPLSGFYRVAVENISDFSKYFQIFKPKFEDMGQGTLSRYVEDSNGNKIIFPDNDSYGQMWIAKGDMDFKLHTTSPRTSFMCRLGVNDLGDTYYNDPFINGIDASNLYINYGSHNFTEILRNAGLKDFMKKRVLLDDTWVR